MFGRNKDQHTLNDSGTVSNQNPKGITEQQINKIASGTVIVGDVNAEGDFRVEGRIIGNMVCSARLVVSESGFIQGQVDARNITVEGEIKGNVISREILQIEKTGRIYGDIYTQKLLVQIGAVFTGKSHMSDAAKEALGKAPIKAKELLGGSGPQPMPTPTPIN